MWLVEVVNANKQPSVYKKNLFNYRISVIKSQIVIFLNFKLKGTILFLGSVNVPMSAKSTKLYFIKIG